MSTMHEAEQEWLEPPEGGPDYLQDKPEGHCTWCGGELVDVGCPLQYQWCSCGKFDSDETEDENRVRYAEERLKGDNHETLVSREMLRTYRDAE